MAVKDFLPSWAKEVADIPEDGEVATRHARLDMRKWVVAFDNLALAYAANDVSFRRKVFLHESLFFLCTLQIWTYADSKAHLRVCLQVAGKTSRVGHRRAHVRPLFVFQLMLAPRGVGTHWRRCIMTYACLLGTNVRREVFPLMSVLNVSVSALALSFR